MDPGVWAHLLLLDVLLEETIYMWKIPVPAQLGPSEWEAKRGGGGHCDGSKPKEGRDATRRPWRKTGQSENRRKTRWGGNQICTWLGTGSYLRVGTC